MPLIGTLTCFIDTFCLLKSIFMLPDFNMRFIIDIKMILKKWLVQLMCMVRFLCRLDGIVWAHFIFTY